ncbi:MAG: DNA primase [Chloroflexi bacterium]|nr:DNA primase [Chloroflexota bacterium]MDA1146461.1 DNA primase [Chloroflexota bacterium]
MSTIDEVKNRLDLVDTVSSYVPDLKQTGRNWKARCPFHNERTPSFVVDPARGTWHCFGSCATGGDVIEFVRRVEGLEFRDALRLCAERAGVELRKPSEREREERDQHERLLRANEAAAVFFRAALDTPEGADAKKYATERGLDEATIERWQIGYAPDDWRALTEHLTARGFNVPDLVEAGLVIEGERGAYDRFRHRLIFPTRDQQRRLIGFGARALRAEDNPKYLNTPQTPLFDKSGSLYGIDQASEAIRRGDRAIVVEGYMDVIAAHQFGFNEVIASMGTSLTEKQMTMLKRYTRNIVLALDADNAGSEATLRGVQIVANAADHEQVPVIDWRGLVGYQDQLKADIRVVSLSAGDDPDSLIRQAPDRFRELLDGALPVTDHLFAAIGGQVISGDPRSRSRAVEALAPAVAAIVDPVVRSHYIQRLARLGGIDERLALQFITRAGGGTGPTAPRPVASRADLRRARVEKAVAPGGEIQILQLLVQRVECREIGRTLDADLFEDPINRAIFEDWKLEREIEATDDLDEPLAERLELLREAKLAEFEARHVEGMVVDIATKLRLRRSSVRVQAAAVEQAEAVRATRNGRASQVAISEPDPRDPVDAVDTVDPDEDELESTFLETVSRQRELRRQYRESTDRSRPKQGPVETPS